MNNIKLDEKLLDEIHHLLEDNYNFVKENYNGKENQLLIDKALVDAMLEVLGETPNPKDTLKEIIRELFELNQRDIVIYKNGNIFIKEIDESLKTVESLNDKKNDDVRFNGFNEEDLKAFYHEFLYDELSKNFIKNIAKEFVDKYIIKRKISNEEYEAKVFAYVKILYYKKLIQIYENKSDFFMGFAGFLFRNTFSKFFEAVADLLLKEVSRNNKIVIDFLEYYSMDTIVVGGVKYKVPAIRSNNGMKWRAISMLNIVKPYFNSKAEAQRIRTELKELNEEKKKYYDFNGRDPIDNIKYYTTLIKKEEEIIKLKEERITKLEISLRDIKEEDEKHIAIVDIRNLKEDISSAKKQIETYKKAIVPKEIELKYKKIIERIDDLTKKLYSKEKIIAQNEKPYNTIKKALVKALISKKKELPSANKSFT